MIEGATYMGLMKAMRILAAVPDVDTTPEPPQLTAAQAVGLPMPQLSSPFAVQPSSLSTIVWSELLDQAGIPATRAEAMSIPAIAKARHVVAPQVADTPLVVLDAEDNRLPAPTWVYRTDDGISPFHRMLWTVDDLIFHGWSLWACKRGADTFPLQLAYVSKNRWTFDKDSTVLVDDKPVDSRAIVLIPGPHEGILTFGRTTIRHSRQLLKAAATAGMTPNAQTELRQTQPPPATWTKDDVTELLDGWADARRGDRGGVAFTSYGIEAIDHGSIDAQLLVEGRNAAAVDCARIVGVTAAMVDATAPKASLNYETTQGRGLEHTRYGVEPYMAAIQARLSLDDVVPRGQRVRFDIANDVDTDDAPGPDPTGPTQED